VATQAWRPERHHRDASERATRRRPGRRGAPSPPGRLAAAAPSPTVTGEQAVNTPRAAASSCVANLKGSAFSAPGCRARPGAGRRLLSVWGHYGARHVISSVFLHSKSRYPLARSENHSPRVSRRLRTRAHTPAAITVQVFQNICTGLRIAQGSLPDPDSWITRTIFCGPSESARPARGLCALCLAALAPRRGQHEGGARFKLVCGSRAGGRRAGARSAGPRG
jgi:hypothetical protein